MSRPDLLASLRETTPPAPAELRLRVLSLAAEAAPPPRRWRQRRLSLAAVALVAVALAAIGAATLLQSSGSPQPAREAGGALAGAEPVLHSPATGNAGKSLAPGAQAAPGFASSAVALPGPSSTRAQAYGATLQLRLPNGPAVAAAARRAVEIAQGLGGFPASVKISVAARTGTATIVLRVPRARVSVAIGRLAALGSVTGEHVSISDLQTGIDTVGVRIVRLERELAAAINGPQSAASRRLIAALTAQIEGLQRAGANTLRTAHDATVKLALSTSPRTPPRPRPRPRRAHEPFHDLGVAFRDAGIGAVYALAIGVPLALLAAVAWWLAARLRRRREERLLSRS